MINKVILIGNLGKDPEVRYLEGNVCVAKLSIATNENYKDKKGDWQKVTEWHNLVMWREIAERAEKQLKKGDTIYVEGKLTHRKYQDKDGKDQYVTEVVVNTFRSLEKKEKTDNFPSSDDAPGARTSTESSQAAGEGSGNSSYDDLPF